MRPRLVFFSISISMRTFFKSVNALSQAVNAPTATPKDTRNGQATTTKWFIELNGPKKARKLLCYAPVPLVKFFPPTQRLSSTPITAPHRLKRFRPKPRTLVFEVFRSRKLSK